MCGYQSSFSSGGWSKIQPLFYDTTGQLRILCFVFVSKITRIGQVVAENLEVFHNTGWVRCIHSPCMWRCCLLSCTQLKDLIHPDESPMYALYCYRFSCRSVQQRFWEPIAKLVDRFWILITLFAAFRNCRSVRSNFTAQSHLCFPLSDDPVNRETSQEKPVKYHTWVGRQKRDGQKSAKSVFTAFANDLSKASRWRF